MAPREIAVCGSAQSSGARGSRENGGVAERSEKPTFEGHNPHDVHFTDPSAAQRGVLAILPSSSCRSCRRPTRRRARPERVTWAWLRGRTHRAYCIHRCTRSGCGALPQDGVVSVVDVPLGSRPESICLDEPVPGLLPNRLPEFAEINNSLVKANCRYKQDATHVISQSSAFSNCPCCGQQSGVLVGTGEE